MSKKTPNDLNTNKTQAFPKPINMEFIHYTKKTKKTIDTTRVKKTETIENSTPKKKILVLSRIKGNEEKLTK